MSDEENTIELTESEQEASKLGWCPKDQWKGPENRWVDADTFLQTQSIVLPILRKTNQGLHDELARLRSELTSARATINTLEESYEADLEARVAAAKIDLADRLKVAREEGDTAAELQIMEEHRKLDAADKPKGAGGEGAPPAKTEQPHPDYVEWIGKHQERISADPTFQRKLASLAAVIAAEPNRPIGKAFFEEIDKRLAEIENAPRGGTSKVNGGGPAGGGGPKGGSRNYSSLPSDAKEACNAMAINKVGKNRAYKTEADWREAYAKNYYNLVEKQK